MQIQDSFFAQWDEIASIRLLQQERENILVLVSLTPSTKEEVIIQRGLSLLDRIGSSMSYFYEKEARYIRSYE